MRDDRQASPSIVIQIRILVCRMEIYVYGIPNDQSRFIRTHRKPAYCMRELKILIFTQTDRFSVERHVKSFNYNNIHSLSFPRKRESTKSITFMDPCFRMDDSADRSV